MLRYLQGYGESRHPLQPAVDESKGSSRRRSYRDRYRKASAMVALDGFRLAASADEAMNKWAVKITLSFLLRS